MTNTVIAEARRPLGGPISSVRFLETGAGQPIVLLHGNPDNADEWRGVMARLAPDFRCIAPDLPGYGQSKPLPRSFHYSRSEQVAFLDSLLAALEVTAPIVLVVHDIGAMMGVPWAAKNLKRVSAMLITNTVAFEGFQWFETARLWGDASFLGRVRANLLMAAIGVQGGAPFHKAFSAQNPQLPAAEVDRMTQTFACNPTAKEACLRQFRQVMRPDFFDGFDRMNEAINRVIPMQVLWGDDDPFVATANSARFATKHVRILPGVGHWTPIIAPDEVAESIRALVTST